MAIQPSGNAPYAPASAVLNIIDRYRNHGLSAPFTLEVLERAGITESLGPRTLQALKLLDLVQEDGNPTDEFTDLSKARSDEYEARLAAIVRNAYADVFAFCDPATDPVERVEDAFRSYTPRSQRARMVSLFLGLCRAAGIVEGGTRAKRSPSTPGTRRTVQTARPSLSTARRVSLVRPPKSDTHAQMFADSIPPALAGLIAQLPETGSVWTTRQRGNFLTAFGAALDVLFDRGESQDPGIAKEEWIIRAEH
jgi:hypothetical protein